MIKAKEQGASAIYANCREGEGVYSKDLFVSLDFQPIFRDGPRLNDGTAQTTVGLLLSDYKAD